MDWLRQLRFRFLALFRKRELEADMAEEIGAHLTMEELANRAKGLNADEARFAAQRQFGGIEQIKEQARDEINWGWLEQFGRDIVVSVRSLRKSSGFTLAVVLTLALCIGANTTIVSALYSLVLKPPPVRDAEQFIEIYNIRNNVGQPSTVTAGQYIDYEENADLLAGIAAYFESNSTFGGDLTADRYFGARVSASYFELLGAVPLHGRLFNTEDGRQGSAPVVVLGRSFWEEQFRSDPSIVGQQIELTNLKYTVIGIAPRSAECVDFRCKLFFPSQFNPALLAAPAARIGGGVRVFARMKPGVTPARALAQLEAIDRRFYEQQADPATRNALDQSGQKVRLGRFRDVQAHFVKPGLVSLQAGVLFVLLIGCVNVANLMLARFNSRQAEMGVRQALGASRGAIVRQLLTEALLLTLAGAAVGLGLAWAGVRVINGYLTAIILQAAPVEVDGTILAVTLLVSLGVASLIGLLPCLQMWGGESWAGNVLAKMQGGSRGASGSRGLRRASGVLVTAQVAIALVLLVGAGLLIRSFAKVISIDSGMDAERVFMGRISLPPGLTNVDAIRVFEDRLVAKLREIPGVEKATFAPSVLMYNTFNNSYSYTGQLHVRDSSATTPGVQLSTNVMVVGPDFFATFGIPFLEGRDFQTSDLPRTPANPNAQPVVIVDRATAERYFPGRSAIGQHLATSRGPPPANGVWPVIVGVVENARWTGLEDHRRGLPFIFYSGTQSGAGQLSLAVRMASLRPDIAKLVRAKIHEMDPRLPFYFTGTAREKLDEFLANRRGIVLLLGALALLALLLSAVGIYGVLAYDVTQRTREIGIRGALGATRGQVVGMILKQGLWKAGIGLFLGLVGAFFLTRNLGSLLFEVQPTDPAAYAAVSLVLLAVALAASYLPARRAARVNPVVALRCE